MTESLLLVVFQHMNNGLMEQKQAVDSLFKQVQEVRPREHAKNSGDGIREECPESICRIKPWHSSLYAYYTKHYRPPL